MRDGTGNINWTDPSKFAVGRPLSLSFLLLALMLFHRSVHADDALITPRQLLNLSDQPFLAPDAANTLATVHGMSPPWLGESLGKAINLWQEAPLSMILLLAGLGLALFTLISWKRRPSDHLQQVLDALPDAVALFDRSGQLKAINHQLKKLLPYELEVGNLAPSTSQELYSKISPDAEAIQRARNEARESALDPNATLRFEVPGFDRGAMLIKERPTADGGVAVSVHGTYTPANGGLSDPLTELPTRSHLIREISNRCSSGNQRMALSIVDLKSFRQINDSYGRSAGDELLRQVAQLLRQCMPDDALIARTAGDEFAVLLELPDAKSSGDNDGHGIIAERLTRVLALLGRGLKVGLLSVPARASVGIAYAPEHGLTVTALIQAADSACAHAKRQGDNVIVVYDSLQQREAKRRHQIEVGLQQAIARDELSLQYQPQIDVRTRMTCGMEALLRWDSPEFGRVPPADFIPIAEHSGIINELGNWVLERAIEDYQRLARYGMSPAMLSVNLSRKQFDQDCIVSEIAGVLERTGFDPTKLCLEITETALFRDSDALRKILADLTGLGARLAIDDFGVGYSSLLELRDFPIGEVKIDRAFISDIASNENSQDIVKAVVSIAGSIGAYVVAEGIENQAQFDTIASLGCDRAQGFYLCEPMGATTFPDVVLSE